MPLTLDEAISQGMLLCRNVGNVGLGHAALSFLFRILPR
jgi:hypothetical protein